MKMSKSTREALEDSIEHWEQVTADPLGQSVGWKACALCRKFILASSIPNHSSCDDCPVFLHTGKVACKGTPYPVYDLAISRTGEEGISVLRQLANDELQFLISLRETKSCKTSNPTQSSTTPAGILV